MQPIETLADPNLLTAAEQMLTQSVLSWSAWQRLEAAHHPDCIVTRSDIDFPFFNNVMCPNLQPQTAPQRIAQLLEDVGQKKRAVCWWVTASSAPKNLTTLLEQAGAAKVQEDRMMAVELPQLPPLALPEGLEVREVETEAQLRQWTAVVAPAHGIPPEICRHWTDAYAAAGFGSEQAVNRHFIALIQKQPVGASTLISAAGLAGLANVATDAAYRGRGIGTAMTLWPLKVAQQAGYNVAFLSASADGEPVYARLGFQRYENVAVYLWRPPVASGPRADSSGPCADSSGVSVESSGAFMEVLSLKPLADGTLDGLTFTVKDNIDIAGRKTSYGSPSWRKATSAAVHNALGVDELLAAGATCVGKVVADEFTYSLQGENPFYGTPLNLRAPDRIPGGSSSGSASSVACHLADFSLGTDSGGSLRVPASFCGVWGMRPSLHRISEAGVLPFMPSVSTVGVVAADFDILDRTMGVLLRSGPARSEPLPEVREPLQRIILLEDALALSDEAVRDAATSAAAQLAERANIPLERLRFSEMVGPKGDLRGMGPQEMDLREMDPQEMDPREMDLVACNERALRNLQTAEFQSSVGSWIETHKPELGWAMSMAYENVKTFDRSKVMTSFALCEDLFRGIKAFLQPGTVVCFPSTPTVAPLKGSLQTLEAVGDFYGRTMAVTCFAGVGRLPEISAPWLSVAGCPVGLSWAAAPGQDEFLLGAVRSLLVGP